MFNFCQYIPLIPTQRMFNAALLLVWMQSNWLLVSLNVENANVGHYWKCRWMEDWTTWSSTQCDQSVTMFSSWQHIPHCLRSVLSSNNPFFFFFFKHICHTKCFSAEGSLAHLFWFCPTLHNFWTAIFEWLSKAYSRDIQPNHDLAIFGCSTRTFELLCDIQTVLHLSMVVAKKLILLTWKSTNSPGFTHWLREMLSVIQMERPRLDKTDTQNRLFLRIWGPFLAQWNITPHPWRPWLSWAIEQA